MRFGATRVHARSLATQFRLQIALNLTPEMRREASRVSFLMCPFCVRALFTTSTTRPRAVWARRTAPTSSAARRSACSTPERSLPARPHSRSPDRPQTRCRREPRVRGRRLPRMRAEDSVRPGSGMTGVVRSRLLFLPESGRGEPTGDFFLLRGESSFRHAQAERSRRVENTLAQASTAWLFRVLRVRLR